MRLPPAKTSLVIVTLLILFAAPDFIPAFKDYRVFDWHNASVVLDFHPRQSASNPVEEEQQRLKPDTEELRAEAHPLVDASMALDPFYAALLRTEQRQAGAVTQILHYGDSPTTADLITADVRALFQKQFGDAGHGFALIAKPWAWYGHRGIEVRGSGWRMDAANQIELRDGLFGLGGVSFRGSDGASARITVKDGSHQSVEVSYLKQPQGGSFALYVEDQPLGTIDTNSEGNEPGFATFPIPEGSRKFEIKDVHGNVRLFGVRFGKQTTGVVYNSLGLNGASVTVLGRQMNEAHWAAELQHARPDLVILNYGTNESVYAAYVDTSYEKELRLAIGRLQRALPGSSIMVMSPMDRGIRDDNGEIVTVPALHRLINIQQRVAAETKCAFFNTFQAMGGPGTMGRWYQAEPRLVGADFIHPMPAGARMVGNLLYKSILTGYNGYKMRQLQLRSAKLEEKN
jgi:lysophospholipase L1-like esterase